MARKMTPLESAAASEDRLHLLRQLRDALIEAFEQAECVRDKEPIARRLQSLATEIDELAGQREPIGPVEEIRRRREAQRRGGQPVAMDRSVTRGRLHG